MWHERLPHVTQSLYKKRLNIVLWKALNWTANYRLLPAHDAYMRRWLANPSPKGRKRTNRVGEIIHSGLVGPMQVTSPRSKRYSMACRDDFPRRIHLFLRHSKREAASKMKWLSALFRTKFNRGIETSRWLGEENIRIKEFVKLMKNEGIIRQRHTPHHRTALQNVRTVL
jgi:hypothetical protein